MSGGDESGLLAAWAEWIIGAAAAAFLAVQTRFFFWHKELVDKHREPDEHGFGTGQTNEIASATCEAIERWGQTHETVLRDIARSQKDQTHYMRWLASRLSGDEPPPPLDT